MSTIIHSHTPQQNIFFKPYTQTFNSFYDHTKDKHNFYIDPIFGKFCRIFGQNTVIEGLTTTSYQFSDDNVVVYLDKGRLIINDTYVEIDSNSQVIYSHANLLDPAGFFVLSASFLNANVLRSNKLRLHLTYFDRNSESHEDFNHNKDKIVLDVFDFDKNNTSNNINSFTRRSTIDTITLDAITYIIRNEVHQDIDSVIDGGPVGFDTDELSSGTYLGQSQDQLLALVLPSGDLITFINFG